MPFLNIRFPLDISYNAVGGPGFMTQVVATAAGYESRNQLWAEARGSWNVAKACRNDLMRAKLISFFRVAKGRANGFRFRDFTDYTVKAGEGVLAATSTPDVYQLNKRYTNVGGTHDRKITRPVTAAIYNGSNNLLVAGVDYVLNGDTGLLTMLGSPAATPSYWLGEFDVPARFDIDKLDLTIEDIDFFRAQSIQVVELRE